MDITIVRARLEDTAEILKLQKLAYQKEANLYEDWTIPPLMQTLSEIQAEFATSIFLTAQTDTRIIGSVRAFLETGICNIGRLMVHPDHRHKGIGTLLMKNIEASFPDAKRFELFTGTKSIDNIRLYARLGYKEYNQQDISQKVRIVFMEKIL
jgi:N-acetylglutamate synthase-like GNAT family acetyltransferase